MKSKVITISLISILSILLWVFISLSGEFFTTLHFPVKVINVADNTSVANISTTEVILSLKAQGWQLAKMTFGLTPDFLVSANEKLGTQTITLRNVIEINPWISSHIQVLELHPERVQFTVEKNLTKKVKIAPDIDLVFKPGYGLVSEIIVSDDSVVITGPESKVEQINFVTTKKQILSGLDRKTSVRLKLKEIQNVDFDITECSVQLDIQKIVDKSFDDIYVETRSVPGRRRLQLFPDKISVVLRGGINILGKLDNTSLKAYVLYRDALNDTLGSIEPKIEIPEQTTFIDCKPRRLEYIIKQY